MFFFSVRLGDVYYCVEIYVTTWILPTMPLIVFLAIFITLTEAAIFTGGKWPGYWLTFECMTLSEKSLDTLVIFNTLFITKQESFLEKN